MDQSQVCVCFHWSGKGQVTLLEASQMSSSSAPLYVSPCGSNSVVWEVAGFTLLSF